MGAIKLQIGMQGDRQFNRVLITKKNQVEDFRPIWSDIRNFLMITMREQFATQGARTASWKPLSRKYAAWKTKNYPGQTILRLTDRLFRSLTVPGSSDMIYESTPREMKFGTKVEYAAKHQFGVKPVPRRRFLSLTQADRDKIRLIIQKALTAN